MQHQIKRPLDHFYIHQNCMKIILLFTLLDKQKKPLTFYKNSLMMNIMKI